MITVMDRHSSQDADANNSNKKVVFKNCTPFTDCISKTNNIQIVNGKKVVVVMLMYNLIECRDNHWKTSGSLWKYYKDEASLGNNSDSIVDFTGANHMNNSSKFKQKVTGEAVVNDRKNYKIMASLKYVSTFRELLESL